MVDILLLLKRKCVPSRNLVPHYLKISEFIDEIFEFSVLCRLIRRAGCKGCGKACDRNHFT